MTPRHRLPGKGEPAYLIDSPGDGEGSGLWALGSGSSFSDPSGARRFSIWDVRPEELKDKIPQATHV